MKNISFCIIISFVLFISLTGYASPLIDAADAGKIKTVAKLLEKGADVNEQDEDGKTARMNAAYWGYTKVVKLLIEKGADVNKQVPEYGFTALMYAAEEGHLEVVKLLLEKGAIIDMQTMGGKTALAFAAYDDEPETVKFLLEKGADIDMAIAYLEKIASKIKNAAAGLKMLKDMKR